jgi:hypothetical protein
MQGPVCCKILVDLSEEEVIQPSANELMSGPTLRMWVG